MEQNQVILNCVFRFGQLFCGNKGGLTFRIIYLQRVSISQFDISDPIFGMGKMAKDIHESAFVDDQTIFWRQNRYFLNDRHFMRLTMKIIKTSQNVTHLMIFLFSIGLYFAWLGFYTKSLIFPSIIGIITVLFGFGTMNTFELNPVT